MRFKFREAKGHGGEIASSGRTRCGSDGLGGVESRVRSKKLDVSDMTRFGDSFLAVARGGEERAEGGGGGDDHAALDKVGTPDNRRSIASSRRRR